MTTPFFGSNLKDLLAHFQLNRIIPALGRKTVSPVCSAGTEAPTNDPVSQAPCNYSAPGGSSELQKIDPDNLTTLKSYRISQVWTN